MRGYVATTDYDWYRFLAERPDLEEVNFWSPSGRTDHVDPGLPFFFKLKAPHHAIAGFGVFVRSEVLPDWLAWECFGPGNGAASLDELRTRLRRLRQRNDVAPERVPSIGCRILTRPVFFPRDQWVRVPGDWRPNIVAGKGYDLTQGEGLRLLADCRERALDQLTRRGGADPVDDYVQVAVAAYGEGRIVQPRLGQGTFRLAVADAYGKRCAVTGEHSLPALEAAHIRPYALELQHSVRNGLLLRGDLHRLFDRGYVTVDADGIFRVSPQLREKWRNGRVYYEKADQPVALPKRPDLRPDRDKLDWHAREIFLAS